MGFNRSHDFVGAAAAKLARGLKEEEGWYLCVCGVYGGDGRHTVVQTCKWNLPTGSRLYMV